MSLTRDVVLKMLAVFCAAAVTASLLVAHQYPSVGYELSIYSSTPVLVWCLLLLSLVGGIGIVIHELATERYQGSRTYLVGFAVILLTTVAFLCVPYVRNYVCSTRADQLGHIGFVKDILWTGHIPAYNPYPITHTMLAQISSITQVSAPQVVNMNTAVMFVVFVLMIYVLATAVLPHKGQQLLAALVAGGAMAGVGRYYLVPNTWSILMLPLLFYCYFKSDKAPFKVLLIILLVVYPFFHPLSSLIVIAALAVMELPKPIYSRVLRRLRMHVPPWMGSRPVLWPVLLELAIFLPWVLTREAFRPNVRQLWHQLTSGQGGEQIAETGEQLGKAGLHGLDIVTIGVKLYGEIFILAGLAVLGIIMILRQLRAGDEDHAKYRLLLLGVLLVLACLFYAAFYVGIPGTEAVAAGRILVYIEVASIPLAAFTLWQVSKSMKFRHLAWSSICILLAVAALLNLASHYSSPYVVRPGEEVTQSDLNGMTWYLENKSSVAYSYYIASPPARFAQYLLGNTTANSREDIKYETTQFSSHFSQLDSDGTDNYSTLGEQFTEPIYVNVHKYDKMAYQTVWRNLDRFNDVDYQGLERDPTVDRIYSNGEVDVLLVTPRPAT